MSKPNITRPPPPSSDLLSRLSTFLPQLSAANESLERELVEAGGSADARNIEHVSDDEETYIEMNLGLGVLEEIRNEPDDDSSETEPGNPDPIATALNPTPAKKPVIQLIGDNNDGEKAPHGIKWSAPPDSDESDSNSNSDWDSDSEGEEGGEELETILSPSKRHGKGPRGNPSIEEVAESKNTSTPEKHVQRG